jgi:HEAT repeats
MPASTCPLCGSEIVSGECPTCAASAKRRRARDASLTRIILAPIVIGAAIWGYRIARTPAPTPASTWSKEMLSPPGPVSTAAPLPTNPTLEQLTAVLLTDQDETRIQAAEALAKKPDLHAVPALVFTLNDRNRPVRGLTVDTPGMEKGEPRGGLAANLVGNRDRARARAAEALGKILGSPDAGNSPEKESALSALVAAVDDRDSGVRNEAITSLGEIHDPSTISVLIRALQKGDESARPLAADALGNFKDPLRIPALIAALEDKESSWHASYALAESNDPSAAQALWSALRRRRFDAVSGAGDLFVRQCAPADEGLVIAFLKAMHELSKAENSSNPRLQEAARKASASGE